MAISKFQKMTLLAEKKYLNEVLLSLQNSQAVELIPTSSNVHNELVSDYYESNNQEELDEENRSTNQMFEAKSRKNEVSRLTNLLEDIRYHIEFVDDILPDKGFFAKLNEIRDSLSLYDLEEYMVDIDVTSLVHEAEAYEKEFNTLKEDQEKLTQERAFLERWHYLDFNPKVTDDFQITRAYVGAIDTERVDDLLESLSHFDEIYTEEIHYTEEESIYLVITSEPLARDVEQALTRNRFERLTYEYENLPAAELERNKAELKDISGKLNFADEQVDRLEQLLKDLKISEEYIYATRERERARENVLESEHLFALTGWIEEKTVDEQINRLKKQIGSDNLHSYIEEVKETEVEEVPTKFENRKSTSAFENIVTMYSVPQYDEIDPTPFVQPFSILFFGMMTADAGYGLLGLIVIFLALKFLNLGSGMKKNLEFFGQLMIGTTAAGLFFGSFFGFELPFGVMSLSDQLLEIMVLSMGIGLVHLILGLFLNTIKNNRKKEYATSFTDGYAWILILLAAITIAINMFLGGPAIITPVAVGVILLSLLATVLINFLSNENKVDGAVQGVFSIFDVTSYIGDVISYTRLTALGVASANIGMAFNLVIGLLPPVARFTIGILIFIGLHLFNMFIAMISGYVHTLRLNYVEFFGKFYEGGGHEFQPIPLLQKHVFIENTVKE